MDKRKRREEGGGGVRAGVMVMANLLCARRSRLLFSSHVPPTHPSRSKTHISGTRRERERERSNIINDTTNPHRSLAPAQSA